MPLKSAKKVRPGRPKELQVRIGAVERRIIAAALRYLKSRPCPPNPTVSREAAFTAEIARNCPRRGYLGEFPIERTPQKAVLFGRRFFPDLWIAGPNRALLAIEVKKLANHHKASFKEALAQSAIYSTRFKSVVLVLYDHSPGKSYKHRLRPGNRDETRFSGKLRANQRVHLMVL